MELAVGEEGQSYGQRMCHDSARGRAAKAAETIAGLAAHKAGKAVERRVVFRGRGWRSGGLADLADLAFSKRDESTEVAKTGGQRAGPSAEWHAWTEPDHACPDGRTDITKTDSRTHR